MPLGLLSLVVSLSFSKEAVLALDDLEALCLRTCRKELADRREVEVFEGLAANVAAGETTVRQRCGGKRARLL
jgi:hypothetical protein